jgi:hypothetical protein
VLVLADSMSIDQTIYPRSPPKRAEATSINLERRVQSKDSGDAFGERRSSWGLTMTEHRHLSVPEPEDQIYSLAATMGLGIHDRSGPV